MGLSVSLQNALSGMRTGQSSLDILSRNVANAGTPGYHRQSLTVIETMGSSPSVRTGAVTRSFSQSLQAHYTREISDASFAATRASVLDRLQSALGKPGSAGSLDTLFNDFRNSLSALATSPDAAATRGEVISRAQSIANTLNRLSNEVQALRREAEAEIGNSVAQLNQLLTSLKTVNDHLADQSADPSSRAAMADQRDRLIGSIAEHMDVRAEYAENGTVRLMTRSGLAVFDNVPAQFEFRSGGQLSAGSLYSPDAALNGVGSLTMRSAGGLAVDLVGQNILTSGRLKSLIDLRDGTLVGAQSQLDDIAASLAQSLSTVETAGTAASSGAASGFELDLSAIRPGNEFTLSYTQGGVERDLRVLRVDDASQLPMDYVDGAGNRVVGMSFAGGAAGVAAQLSSILGPAFAVSGAGSTLTVLDDGVGNTTDVGALTARTTASATQGQGLGLSLFVDSNNADFTNAISGVPQIQGFASRITVNSAVKADNRLLVQHTAGGSLGDASRAEYLLERLGSASYSSQQRATQLGVGLTGTTGDVIAQALNYQGNSVADALAQKQTRALSLEALGQRMESEYGVNVDEEMARLIELQNAYAANARIISVVQDLINRLFEI